MKTYTFDGYKITLRRTYYQDRTGHEKVKYTFRDPSGKIIFKGDDLGASPLHPPESKETAIALLSFLTCQEHDVESDYFEKYTKRQLQFRDSMDCENLQRFTFDD